jgi:hypothetical protein
MTQPRSGVCMYCLCTDERACPDGCSWHNKEHTVCTTPACVEAYKKRLEKVKADK